MIGDSKLNSPAAEEIRAEKGFFKISHFSVALGEHSRAQVIIAWLHSERHRRS